MPAEKVSLREICREVGVQHIQVVEVLRRIARRVKEDDVEVITQTVGTFYLKKSRQTTRKLKDVVYDVPAKESVALRGPRFPGQPIGEHAFQYLHSLPNNFPTPQLEQAYTKRPEVIEMETLNNVIARVQTQRLDNEGDLAGQQGDADTGRFDLKFDIELRFPAEDQDDNYIVTVSEFNADVRRFAISHAEVSLTRQRGFVFGFTTRMLQVDYFRERDPSNAGSVIINWQRRFPPSAIDADGFSTYS